ncbi:hypothetical protein [Streptomyces durocortorensis]|uniref:hypothetical protein n=1 Tax=Streptomyces durocortorensis TaxID=2811104 RepID=UPI001EF4D58E|nr:hypothetical protein [Streptomyces durocortorensis]
MAPNLPSPGGLVECGKDLKDCIKKGAEGAVDSVVGSAVESFANAIGEAAAEALKALNGVWMKVGTGNSLHPEGGTGLDMIIGETRWLVAYVDAASLLVAAIRTEEGAAAVARRARRALRPPAPARPRRPVRAAPEARQPVAPRRPQAPRWSRSRPPRWSPRRA